MMQSFNFMDYLILGVMGLSILFGFINGFIRSILSVCVWIAAFFISAFYGPHLATTFSLVTDNPTWQLWLSYGTVFLAAVVIGFIIRLILNLILTGGETGILNRFCGALFGCVRGILIVLVFVWFAILVNMNQNPAFQASQLLPFFAQALNRIEALFPAANANAQNAITAMNSNVKMQMATIDLTSTAQTTSTN